MILYQYPPTPTVSLTTGPVAFIKNLVSTNVEESTATPANNRALPSQLFIYKDGVQLPISVDTGTPANTLGVPVILTGAAGPINITAGDLNVQLTDQGPNADVTRIGDGTTQLAIKPVTGEALVHDTDANVFLSNMDGYLANLQQAVSSEGGVLPPFAIRIAGKDGAVFRGLVMTPAGEAKVSDADSLAQLQLMTTDIDVLAATVGTSGSSALGQGQAVLGWDGTNNRFFKVNALGEQAVNIVSSALPTGASTAAKQDIGNTSLGNIDTDLGAPSDSAVTNPASNASVIAALKGMLTLAGLTNTKLDTLIGVSTAALDSTDTSSIAGAVVTFTPPADAELMIVQNSLEASSPVRFTGNLGTPSVTNGYYLGIGQSTSTIPAGIVKVARTSAVSGENGDVTVAWFK